MRMRSLLALLCATTALACTDEGPRHVAGENPGGNAGGSGGTNTGGSSGAGGAGGTAGSGGTTTITEPGWDGLAPALAWRYQGFGEVFSLATADFTGDGTMQVAVGGRRPVLLSSDGSRVLWYADWVRPADNLSLGGDNDWVYQLAAIPAEGGRSNLLVTSSMGDAALLDGRDGTAIWRAQPAMRFPFPFFTTLETSSGPAFFPNFGTAAHSLATGEAIWPLPATMVPTFVQKAARAGENPGLFLVDEGDARVGGPGPGKPAKVAGVTADGALLFVFDLPDGQRPTALGAADLDGAGTASAIVATPGLPLRAWDAEGNLRWERTFTYFDEDPLRAQVTHLLARDLDGDGTEEILVIARDTWAADFARMPTLILALDAQGNERWRTTIEGLVQQAFVAQWGGEPTLLLATGVPDLGARGAAVTVRLGDGLEWRTGFRYELPGEIRSIALQGETLILGTSDGILRAVDRNGTQRWTHYLSAFLYASAAVPMADEDWVATADSSANLALVDATGARRWYRRLAVGDFGWSVDVAAAHLGGSKPSVVAVAKATNNGYLGSVDVFSADGDREASLPLPSEPAAVEAADLDGDGVDEILVLEQARQAESACHLRAFDAHLEPKWAVALELCQSGEISVADVIGDGTRKIAVRTDPGLFDAPFTLSLIAADGTLHWKIPEEFELSLWVRAVPGGVVSGGLTTERNGFVALREPKKGEKQWNTLLPPKPDPTYPEGDVLPGASWFGHVIPGEDGFRIAATTYANDLALLDGATGEIAWSVATERDPWPLPRRNGGPVVYVPGTETVPPHLVTAQYADTRQRADAVVVSMEGEIVGHVPMDTESNRIHLLRRKGAAPVVAAKGLLGVWAVGIAPQE